VIIDRLIACSSGQGRVGTGPMPEARYAGEAAIGVCRKFKLIGTPMTEQSHTVLVVEDEKAIRDVIALVLPKINITVLTADSGEKALQIGLSHPSPIDLLVTDVILNGRLNGYELFETLSKHRPAMKVIYISGFFDNKWKANLSQLNPTQRYLEKPFRMADLLAVARDLLGLDDENLVDGVDGLPDSD
jgi:response regulator RpfG family c-di-GMP phosphodiesterase